MFSSQCVNRVNTATGVSIRCIRFSRLLGYSVKQVVSSQEDARNIMTLTVELQQYCRS